VADKQSGVLRARGVTDRGSVRPTNQDHFAIDEALRLCVIADGLGGHNAGEVAARTAVAAVLDTVADRRRVGWPFGVDPSLSEAGNLLRTAIHVANLLVLEAAGTSSEYAGMGTTVVAALVVGDRVSVGHVGDSRLYRFSAGRLRPLTGDDSWMASVIAADPQADAGLLQLHPMRHMLTSVVGSRRPSHVHVWEEPLIAGDRLLLTTDGVHGVLDDATLEGLVAGSSDLAEVANALVRAAIRRGSLDNCTALVAEYTG
jgi:protein phosphatase